MKTLTVEEYETLEFRAHPDAKTCDPRCVRSYTPIDTKPGYSSTVLSDLVKRGLLSWFMCENRPDATHYYTNTEGLAAMSLYRLIQSLGDLKLQGGA